MSKGVHITGPAQLVPSPQAMSVHRLRRALGRNWK